MAHTRQLLHLTYYFHCTPILYLSCLRWRTANVRRAISFCGKNNATKDLTANTCLRVHAMLLWPCSGSACLPTFTCLTLPLRFHAFNHCELRWRAGSREKRATRPRTALPYALPAHAALLHSNAYFSAAYTIWRLVCCLVVLTSAPLCRLLPRAARAARYRFYTHLTLRARRLYSNTVACALKRATTYRRRPIIRRHRALHMDLPLCAAFPNRDDALCDRALAGQASALFASRCRAWRRAQAVLLRH